MPTRLILSAYAGPMPRPVVPIWFLPRKRSVTLSIVEWYDAMTCALALTTRSAHVDAALDQRVELAEQRLGRDDDAVGDDRGAPRRQDAAGQQVGRELLAVDDDGVAGVVAAAGADQKSMASAGGEQVGRLALALVAPLGSEDHDRGHAALLTASVEPVETSPEMKEPRQQHRGSCDPTLPEPGSALDARLGSVAWTRCCSSPTATPARPTRRPSTGPRVLRDRVSVEVTATSNPASSTACCTGPARGGSSSRAATAACTRSSPRCTAATTWPTPARLCSPRDRQRLRPRAGIPLDPRRPRGAARRAARPMDLIVDELGGVVVNNVHVGAGAQASRRGARWKERLGTIGYGSQPRQLGYPIGAAAGRRQAAVPPAARRGRRRGGRRHRPADPDGRDRQRPQRRRRHRADPRGGPGGRQARRDDLARDRPAGRGSGTPPTCREPPPRARRRDLPPRATGLDHGEEFYCAADGEIYGPERHRTWHVEPAAYSMVLP